MDERESKLPVWAQQLIQYLRHQIEVQREPLIREIASLRSQVALLKAKNEALTELLDCAASGGHKTSQEIVKIIEAYDLSLVPVQET